MRCISAIGFHLWERPSGSKWEVRHESKFRQSRFAPLYMPTPQLWCTMVPLVLAKFAEEDIGKDCGSVGSGCFVVHYVDGISYIQEDLWHTLVSLNSPRR